MRSIAGVETMPPRIGTAVARIRTTLIDLALGPELGQSVRRRLSSRNLGEPRISILRCLARNNYLPNVLDAAERAMSKKALRGLSVSVFTRNATVGDNRFLVLTVQPSARLLRLRARISRAIALGLAADDNLSALDPIWFPAQPIFVPEFITEPIPPFVVGVSSAAIYSLNYMGDSADQVLRAWAI